MDIRRRGIRVTIRTVYYIVLKMISFKKKKKKLTQDSGSMFMAFRPCSSTIAPEIAALLTWSSRKYIVICKVREKREYTTRKRTVVKDWVRQGIGNWLIWFETSVGIKYHIIFEANIEKKGI